MNYWLDQCEEDLIKKYRTDCDILEKLEPLLASIRSSPRFKSILPRLDDICLLMENQLLADGGDGRLLPSTWQYILRCFRIHCASMVAQIMSSPAYDIIGWQPMRAPGSTLLYREDGLLKEWPAVARTRKLRTRFPSYEEIMGMKSQNTIDSWCEATNEVSESIKLEIFNEVVTDLSNNAGTVLEQGKVYEAYPIIKEKIGKDVNFIIRSVWFSHDLRSKSREGYRYTVENKKVYFSSALPYGEAIVGYKGDDYDAGYFMMPYIPLSLCGAKWSDQGDLISSEFNGLMTMYAKKLVNADYYVKVKVEG